MFTRLLFFFNDTATTEIYTLSLHDALPISLAGADPLRRRTRAPAGHAPGGPARHLPDRQSTRLNSSHANISYAVFCLKKSLNLVNAQDRSRNAPATCPDARIHVQAS